MDKDSLYPAAIYEGLAVFRIRTGAEGNNFDRSAKNARPMRFYRWEILKDDHFVVAGLATTVDLYCIGPPVRYTHRKSSG